MRRDGRFEALRPLQFLPTTGISWASAFSAGGFSLGRGPRGLPWAEKIIVWSMIEGAALSLWRKTRETFSQMAARRLRSCLAIRRRPGSGTSEAPGVSARKAASGRHAEGRRGRRGDLRRGSPHSARVGGDLWPGRHDGRHAETRPPGRSGPSAPRLENERAVAPRRQRQGRSVVQCSATIRMRTARQSG